MQAWPVIQPTHAFGLVVLAETAWCTSFFGQWCVQPVLLQDYVLQMICQHKVGVASEEHADALPRVTEHADALPRDAEHADALRQEKTYADVLLTCSCLTACSATHRSVLCTAGCLCQYS